MTVDIGANDLLNVVFGCGFDATCIQSALPGAISTMAANLDTILTALQNAEPSAEVLVMNVPDPFAAYAPLSASSIQVFGAFDSALDAVVAAHQDRLVDAFTSGLELAQNDLPSWCEDIVAISCGQVLDVHPTAEGYQDMAELFISAAGYTSLQPH